MYNILEEVNKMKDKCIALLKQRGVELDDIIDITEDLEKPYIDDLNREEIRQDLLEILDKREVYNAVFTGIAIDIAVDEGKVFDDQIAQIIKEDYGLYGVDEVLAYGICNIYGSIALTNFGYVDKLKPGIIQKINDDLTQCNTFLDDIVGALAASAASKLAHSYVAEIKEEVIGRKKKRFERMKHEKNN